MQASASNNRPFVVCLVGPTAAGKTDAAVRLAAEFPFDIISVDSAMVYRHMDIGTAKPDAGVLSVAPHRLIDIRDPWDAYSAGQFCDDARDSIRAIHAQGRIPLLVGGTFLYLRALQHGLAPLPTADQSLRDDIDRRGERDGWPALHAELAALDPEAAQRIRPSDRQRLQRALEVISLTGESLTKLQRADVTPPDFDFVRVVLTPSDRAVLHARIEKRFDAMLAAGFNDEVERLRAMPQMSAASPSMRAVGYRQLWSYLDGDVTKDEAQRQAIVATRRLAKRQLTWLRGEPAALHFDCDAPDVIEQIVAAIRMKLATMCA